MAEPRASLAGLQSTVTALPYADYMTEVLNLLMSVPTHTWAVANCLMKVIFRSTAYAPS